MIYHHDDSDGLFEYEAHSEADTSQRLARVQQLRRQIMTGEYDVDGQFLELMGRLTTRVSAETQEESDDLD
ncbi:MAG: hypothetical protein HJJLKODD_01075 [Phycisphaerae bacterium]|nr:hypothetical protein [Phycisphaerae bacterium]